MAKNVTGELLRQNYELQLKLNEFYRQINQNDGYPFDFESLMCHLQNGIEGRFGQIHPNYKLIKSGIVITGQERNITGQERNRQEILNDSSKYVLGDNFKNKVLAKCTNGKTSAETLRELELLKYKKDKEIMKEMNISEITPNQIAERIIQLGKINQWTIIGYCEGLVVFASPDDGGRVNVCAVELGGWDGGSRLLSRDIEI